MSGFIVLAKICDEWDVLSWGTPDEPYPHMLARRDRVTVFKTRDEAEHAINLTHSIAVAENSPWVKKSQWKIIPVCSERSGWIDSENTVDSGEGVE